MGTHRARKETPLKNSTNNGTDEEVAKGVVRESDDDADDSNDIGNELSCIFL